MGSRTNPANARGRSVGSQIKLLLMVNALPLAAMAYAGVSLYRGTLKLSDVSKRLPPGVGENLVVIIGLFFVLLALVGVPLTILNSLLRDMQRRTIVAAVRWSEIGFFRKIGEILLLVPRWIAYVIFWIIRTAVLLTVIATLALMIVFLVRLMQPTFGDAWLPIEKVMAKIR